MYFASLKPKCYYITRSEEGRYPFIYYLNIIKSTVVIIFHYLKLLKHVERI